MNFLVDNVPIGTLSAKNMKRINKHSIKSDSYTARTLMLIGDNLDDIIFSYINSRLVMRVGLKDAKSIIWKREQYQQNRAIKLLKEKKLLKIKRIGDDYEAKFTSEGEMEYFRLKVLSADLLPDDEVTMVVFDIPETQSKIRKQLRRFLESACFMPIQKSVWISQYDAGEFLTKMFNIKTKNGWIQVFRAKRQS